MAGAITAVDKQAQEFATTYNALTDNEKLFVAHWARWTLHDKLLKIGIPPHLLTKLEVDIEARAVELLKSDDSDIKKTAASTPSPAARMSQFIDNHRALFDELDVVVDGYYYEYMEHFGLDGRASQEEVAATVHKLPDALAERDVPAIKAFPTYNALCAAHGWAEEQMEEMKLSIQAQLPEEHREGFGAFFEQMGSLVDQVAGQLDLDSAEEHETARVQYNALNDNQKLYLAYHLRHAAYDIARQEDVPEALLVKLAVDLEAKATELLPGGAGDIKVSVPDRQAVANFVDSLEELHGAILEREEELGSELLKAFGLTFTDARAGVEARADQLTALSDILANIEVPAATAYADYDTLMAASLLPPTAGSAQSAGAGSGAGAGVGAGVMPRAWGLSSNDEGPIVPSPDVFAGLPIRSVIHGDATRGPPLRPGDYVYGTNPEWDAKLDAADRKEQEDEYNELSDNQKLFVSHWLRHRAYDWCSSHGVPDALIAKLRVDIDALALELLPPGDEDEEGDTPADLAINTFFRSGAAGGEVGSIIEDLASKAGEECMAAFGLTGLSRAECQARAAAGTIPDALANIELPPVPAFPTYDALVASHVLPTAGAGAGAGAQ
ncbi:Hypothetical protein POVN_LOCUS174 [uncultured virus]|nr:Hypothetical protein POVN_LOCUS174 [uncultured virus]